jgi:hypothetical protein
MKNQLLAIALLCSGCAGNVDDPDGQGNGLGGGFQIATAKLTVDGFEPQAPVEGRRAFVHFTFTNNQFGVGTGGAFTGRIGATITPVGSPAYEAPFSWRIDSLARGGVASGVIAFDAPAASHANDLKIFFEDATTKAHVIEVHKSFDVARRFTFGIAPISASQIRSPHNDSDWGAIFAHNPNGPDPVPDTANLGQVASGYFTQHFLTNGVGSIDAIPDVDNVLLGAIVLNAGYFTGTQQNLDVLRSLAINTVTGGPIQFGPDAVNCDGVVALAQHTVSARLLFDSTGGVAGIPIGDPTISGTGKLAGGDSYDNYDYPYPRCNASHYQLGITFAARTRRFDPDIVILPPVVSLNTNKPFNFIVENGTTVDWSVDGGAFNGQIDPQLGTFKLSPNIGPNTQVVVRATTPDGSRTGVAYVSLNPVVPRPVIVGGGFTFVR